MLKQRIGLPSLGLVIVLSASSVLAADRHVYLNRSGGGSQLNDCPNPAHNAKGTSNTDELFYCAGGSSAGKIIGTVTGTVTSSTCTGGGGTVTPVTNGVSADVDRDGTNEVVYGHPQACVWAMATSDSCEVHAGTYFASGAYADSNALDSGTGPSSGCDKNNCWFATVVAPGPSSGAYGTAASPGYLRGAVMNGSTDSWDPNGDKNPADGAYPVIFSGDRNNDGVFDPTSGSDGDNNGTFTGLGANFRGDGYISVMVGCQASTTAAYSWCGTSHADGVWVDTNADGTFDTKHTGNRNPDYLTVKDIEITHYNGGHPGTSGGVRAYAGLLTLGGDGSTDGIVIDHVYVHNNAFSLQSNQENFWTIIDDSHNGSCTKWTEIKNSYLEQNNDKVMDDDCGVNNECGCPKNFHNNLVLLNVTGQGSDDAQNIFYMKSIDTFKGGSKKAHRFWNNEFVVAATADADNHTFMDLQAFGNSMGHGLGELWVYGNIFRSLGTQKMKRFWLGSCGIGTGSWRLYFFNNTFDMTFVSNTNGIWQACTDSGEQVVEKNNAYWSGTTAINTHDTPAASAVRVNEFCSTIDTSCSLPSLTGRTAWWTYPATAPGLFGGLTAYAAAAGGPLDNITANNPCDPDGDGVPGVDYNWDGVNDTSWTDISGRTVTCATSSSPIDAGAIQSGTGPPPDTTPPGNVSGVTRTDKKP
jgi:hypothetical protein